MGISILARKHGFFVFLTPTLIFIGALSCSSFLSRMTGEIQGDLPTQ